MLRITNWILYAIVALLFSFPGFYVLQPQQGLTVLADGGPYQGLGVYVINLDRSPDRYQYILPSVTALGYDATRVSAIDASQLSAGELGRYTDLNSYLSFLGHSPKAETIGCALSHIKTWRLFLESNYEFALILEDDISFDPAQVKATLAELMANKNLWDVSSLEISHRGLPATLKYFNATNQHLVVYLAKVTHTGAYLINRKAATQLLMKALPIKMPIDHYFTRAWEFDLVFTGIEPRMVKQTYGDLDIINTNVFEQQDPSTIMSLRKGVYKLKSWMIRFGYNFMVYLKERNV